MGLAVSEVGFAPAGNGEPGNQSEASGVRIDREGGDASRLHAAEAGIGHIDEARKSVDDEAAGLTFRRSMQGSPRLSAQDQLQQHQPVELWQSVECHCQSSRG